MSLFKNEKKQPEQQKDKGLIDFLKGLAKVVKDSELTYVQIDADKIHKTDDPKVLLMPSPAILLLQSVLSHLTSYFNDKNADNIIYKKAIGDVYKVTKDNNEELRFAQLNHAIFGDVLKKLTYYYEKENIDTLDFTDELFMDTLRQVVLFVTFASYFIDTPTKEAPKGTEKASALIDEYPILAKYLTDTIFNNK